MLESISWSDFIITLVLVAIVYYTAIILLYFYGDVKRILAGKNEELADHDTRQESHSSKSFIGPAIPFDRDQTPSTSYLEESTQVSVSVDEDSERSLPPQEFVTQPLHRTFSQLLEEITALAYIVSKNSKEEISLLFETLLSRYPELAKPHHQSSINQFIIEACHQHGQMELTHHDIDAWWSQALNKS